VTYPSPDLDRPTPEDEPPEGRFVWEGRERDAEASLQYNRARFYDSTAGRWTSQDPLGSESGDGNLYPYARPTEAGLPAPGAAGRAEEGDRRSQESF
jgi:RHS repeat-associated protein